MITGTLKNLSVLSKMGGNFKTAVEFLENLDMATLEPKRFEVDGENVYAFCSDVTLRDPAELPFEIHAKYADIQIVVNGCEEMWQAVFSDDMSVKTPFDAEKDFGLFFDPAVYNTVVLPAGAFAVFFPEDAHKPCCATKDCSQSRKLVVKVKLD